MKSIPSFRPGLVLGFIAAVVALPFSARGQSFTMMYVADYYANTVSTITPAGVVTTFASRFDAPYSLALDQSGNLYVTNNTDNTVSKITPAGVVSTFASGFNAPTGLAFDSNGNLYVANFDGNTVSKVTPSGVVSTFASGFEGPSGLVFDGNGNLYVANFDGNTVSEVTPGGVVSTFASSLDGANGLAFDTNGNLYVANSHTNTVLKITPGGVVSTFASGFDWPFRLAFDTSGNLYVTNSTAGTVSEVSPAGVVSTFVSGFGGPSGLALVLTPPPPAAPVIYAQPQNQGIINGRVVPVAFNVGAESTAGSASYQWQVSTDSGVTWIALSNNSTYSGATTATLNLTGATSAMVGFEYECVVTNTLGSTTSSPAMITLAPWLMLVADATSNTVNFVSSGGVGSLFASGFGYPSGLAFDAGGNLYVANDESNTVSKVTPAGVVSTFASGFNCPESLAFDGAGNLYVANYYGNTVSKITPAGVVSTFASGFDSPFGLAFDASGNLYVTNANFSGTVSKITPAGVVSTFASGFNYFPEGLAFDGSGNLYVANGGSGTVSMVTPAGVVSVFASGFDEPIGLAFDGAGNLDVADSGNGTVSEVSPAGLVSTLASGFTNPTAIAIISSTTITTQPMSVTAGTSQTAVFSVTATGISQLNYQWNFGGSPITGATDTYLVLGNVQTGNAGSYTCTVTGAAGSVTSNPATLTVSSSTDLGRIMNVSVRNNDGPGASQLIAGFVIGGSGTDGSAKSLLVRGDGPLLTSLGLAGLPDPLLSLFQPSVSTTTAFASNQGWANSTTITSVGAAIGAYPFTAGSLDSALAPALAPGAYTANVTGAGGDSGVALAEVYDATTSFTATTPRLVNVSGRCQVGPGANQLIAGFVIGGSTEKTVLVRGVGPLLASLGLTGTLPDPEVSVYQPSVSTTVPLASNTVWGGDAAISSVASSVGAYPFASADSADSALLISLPPGVYTANVTGASDDTGIALVEVYEVP